MLNDLYATLSLDANSIRKDDLSQKVTGVMELATSVVALG